MAALLPDEIVPGVVVRLDPTILTAVPGCSTNAEHASDGDRAVVGLHFFLVLYIDAVDGEVLATPLFSDKAPGSMPLDESKKAGPAQGWIGTTSHFSRWQHWWIPIAQLVQASSGEDTTPGSRRIYASSEPDELRRIADWRHQNRAPWRGL